MKIYNLFVIGVFCTIARDAYSQNYSVVNLDKSLLENANAVIRNNFIKYEVTDTDKATMTCHLVMTILNKNADKKAIFQEYYDKFSKINNISGKIYDSNGKMIKKIKSGDISDYSAIDDYSLYEDDRMKIIRPLINNFPYTIEYEWTVNFNAIEEYPTWNPQAYYDVSVEHSSYQLIIPKNFHVRFRKFNFGSSIDPIESEKVITYNLSIGDLKAIEKEPYSNSKEDIFPMVYVIPEFFKLEHYTCHNTDWQSLGKWQLLLNNQPNVLSDKTKNDLEIIKSKAIDRYNLIKLVYEYVQSKTRYVNISLGIGGLKPFDASVVDKYGYGDCKALSNYVNTLLKQVGIESYFTIVNAGRHQTDIITDESFFQFNHIIVCVPNVKDTIWLECTDQLIPFGFLSDFTDNRHVLLITPEGGKLAKTPRYNCEQNKLNRKFEVQLDENGNAKGMIQTCYSGLQFDDKFGICHYLDPDKQKEAIYNEIGIPSTITNFKFSEHKDIVPSLDEHIELTLTKYAVTMGSRLMLPLNAVNRVSPISKMINIRKTRFRLRMAYFDSDTVLYRLPIGFMIEYVPKPVELKSEFGEYSCKVISNPDKSVITYIRSFKMNDGIYPPEKYSDFVAFQNNISKMDNLKVSLIKNQ